MADAGALAPVVPFNDPSRKRRLRQGRRAGSPGPASSWSSSTSSASTSRAGSPISGSRSRPSRPGTSSPALVFQTGQTIFAGLSYYGILSAAYPGEVSLAPIITAYAVGVAMNNFLPANIGTFVTLLMFVALIPSCTRRRRDRRLPRPEDLLHDRGHVRLPLPLPVGARIVRPQPREHLGAPGVHRRASSSGHLR